MPLTPNTILGPYEIVSPLGAGGMGEVYRARDTRLDREVAIKVLPAHLTRSPEFKQRFEREAKSISQLTHPNICTLHDVGQHDGTDYLVMELLEGETLAQRLTRGALPLEQVLKVGVEIASALDAAHRKGVVHRDLKPGNVMLTKGGAKLLDFGLAKSSGVMDSDPSAVTISQPLTSKGTILGTFQYMAPEQLEGAEADARTDIFAFGAVLYEVATGKRAFDGASRASLIASIMATQPRPISELQPMTPPALDRLIRKCLAKDADARWQSAADVADELRWITESGSQVVSGASVSSRRRGSNRLAWSLTLLSLLAAAAVIVSYSGKLPGRPASVHATIVPPEGTTLVSTSIFAGPVVVSPDGSKLAFVARKGEGRTMLWVRPLGSFAPKALEGTEGATRPFWSADSQQLGFFADNKLKRVSAAGGPVLSVADGPNSRGGTWSQSGTIVYAPEYTGPLFAVPASGGAVRQVTELDSSRNEDTHRYPHFLPDGRHFLYLARASGAGAGRDPAIVVASLDSPERKIVVHNASNIAYASGHLLYVRQNILMAQPFDVNRLETTGEPVTVAQDVRMDERFSLGVFSASQNGILAYQTGREKWESRLYWHDRSGKRLDSLGDSESYFPGFLNISPNGNRVSVGILDPGGLSDIWLIDLKTSVRSKLTAEPGDDTNAIWSPDGGQLIYSVRATGGGDATLFKKPAVSMGVKENLLSIPAVDLAPSSYSPDGKFMLYSVQPFGGKSDIFLLPLEGDRTPRPFVQTEQEESQGYFSPNGQWVAYISDATGRFEVYVAPFPGPGGTVQVSQNGGTEARWRADGKELFYFDANNRLMAAEVKSEGGNLEIGRIDPLFQTRETWMPGEGVRYDTSEDGQRFLLLVPQDDPTTSNISLVVNWPEELKDK